MKKYAYLLVLAAVFWNFSIPGESQSQLTLDYIQLYHRWAIEEMYEYGIPASITLAQGILESGNGQSELAVKGNNHFGIKCKSTWEGNRMYVDDDEKGECFRVYDNAWESYHDHSLFLKHRKWYTELFLIDQTDYKAWAYGLKKCGYATNPKYAEILISLIEKYDLHKYDLMERPLIAKTEEVEIDEDKAPTIDDELPNLTFVNNIKSIKVNEDLSPLDVAMHYDLSLNQIYKYNEMVAGDNFTSGMYVYLQPKRSKAEVETHVVEKGQSMWEISQIYGIKMASLYEKNLMLGNEQAVPGETLQLQKKALDKPRTRAYLEMLKEKNNIFYANVEPISEQQIDWDAGLDKESIDEHTYAVKKIEELKKKTEAKVAEEVKAELPEPVKKEVELVEEVKEEIEKPELKEETAEETEEIVEETKEEAIEVKAQITEEKTSVEPSPEVKEIAEEVEEPELEEKVNETIETVEEINEETSQTEITVEAHEEIPTVEYHEVQAGETLYSLSRKYGISVADIQNWNQLSGNGINIGQKLVVKKP